MAPLDLGAAAEGDVDLWEVVGGGNSGGVVVRAGKGLASKQEPGRLASGALVQALEFDQSASRLRYSLVEGQGPASGWVTIRVKGRELLARRSEEDPLAPLALNHSADKLPMPFAAAGVCEAKVEATQEHSDSKNKEVLRWYSENFVRRPIKRGSDGGRWAAPRRAPQLGASRWSPAPARAEAAAAAAAAVAEAGAALAASPATRESRCGSEALAASGATLAADSSPPLFVTATDTRRPLGDGAGAILGSEAVGAVAAAPSAAPRAAIAAAPPSRAPALAVGGGGPRARDRSSRQVLIVGAERSAQAVLSEALDAERARAQRDAAAKRERRAQFGIGWTPSKIPSSVDFARKQLGRDLPKSAQMVCLLLNEGVGGGKKTVTVAPTSDPAAAVNLEYLSVLLEARRREGREPTFSLDPVIAASDPVHQSEASAAGEGALRRGWQTKRFDPPWLAKTSVGEVMFQADYHLKELSMGAAPPPLLGLLPSCFDLALGAGCGDSEGEEEEEGWNAREWFVVRRAEVLLGEDGALMPRVRLGVEAREQVLALGGGALEDAPATRADHPLVRYAEAFTKNFDAIAERRSVFFQLREVAKAAALAKHLLEADFSLSDVLFARGAAGGVGEASEDRIPQLWNERLHSEIEVVDGRVLSNLPGYGLTARVRGVYGGVQMGLERFPLQEVVVAPPRVSRTELASAPRQLRFAPSRAFVQGMAAGMPKGVDLDLDRFNLSEAADSGQRHSAGGSLPAGSAFWEALDRLGASREEEGPWHWLQALFDPHLSDRRADGAAFVPPTAADEDYVEGVVAMLREERSLARRRLERFEGPGFSAECAGPLFPPSWTSSIVLKHSSSPEALAAAGRGAGRTLRPLPPGEAPRLDRALRSTAPVFDRLAEDGRRFRVYRCGGLEVRTTQRSGSEQREVVRAVFAVEGATAVGLRSDGASGGAGVAP